MRDAINYIEDYMAGKLHGEQLKSFEMALQNDVELKNMVDNYDVMKKASEGILEMELLREVKAARQQAAGSEEQAAKKEAAVTPIYRTLLKYAAAAVVLFGLGWLLAQGIKDGKVMNAEELYAAHYEVPTWPGSRGMQSGSIDYEAKAASTYLSGDLQKAKVYLLDSLGDKDLGRYWLAEMYLERGEYNTVLTYLPTFNPDHIKYERSILVKVMVLLKQGKVIEAKQQVKKLGKDYNQLKKDISKLGN